MATKTRNKKSTVDFSKSIQVIKKTSQKVISEVRNSANDVADDVWKNGEKLTDMATQRAKKAISNIDVRKGVKRVQNLTKEVNEITLETAEELVDNSLFVGEKWQKVAHKAVKGGLKLAGKNQDLAFETLGVVKNQFIKGVKQFGKLRK